MEEWYFSQRTHFQILNVQLLLKKSTAKKKIFKTQEFSSVFCEVQVRISTLELLSP